MTKREKVIAGLLTALFIPMGVGYITLCKKNDRIDDLTDALNAERKTSKEFIDNYLKLGNKASKLEMENAKLKQKLKDKGSHK